MWTDLPHNMSARTNQTTIHLSEKTTQKKRFQTFGEVPSFHRGEFLPIRLT
jgi:hypothetical protein